MRIEAPHRIFAVGQSVLYPDKSGLPLITNPAELNRIVFDDPEGSLVGVLPQDRRIEDRPFDGNVIGDYFPGNLLEPSKLKAALSPDLPDDSWSLPKRRTNSVEEVIASFLAISALNSAGITSSSFDQNLPWVPRGENGSNPLRVAVGLTNSLGPLAIPMGVIASNFRESSTMKLARAGLTGHANMAIIDILGSHGPAILNQAACATALYNILEAFRLLQRGEADIAVVGGYEVDPTNLWIYALAALGAIANFAQFADDPRLSPSPGGTNPAGLAFTEGGSAIVFATEETLARLQIPQSRILAEIIGGAKGQDSSGLVPPNPPQELLRVMREAMAEAGLSPKDIQLHIPHGTGTEAGDIHDLTAARLVFGLSARDFAAEPDHAFPDKPYVTKPKSITGHNMAGSGAHTAITIFEAMRRGVIPRSRNVPVPNGLEFNLVHKANQPANIENGVGSAIGMDGSAAAIIFRRPPESIPVYQRI